jgi:hypothetical protein
MTRGANGSNRIVGAALALAFLMASATAVYIEKRGERAALGQQSAGMSGVAPLAPRLAEEEPPYPVMGTGWVDRQGGRALILEVLVTGTRDQLALNQALDQTEQFARKKYQPLAALRVKAFASIDDVRRAATPLAVRDWSADRKGFEGINPVGEERITVMVGDVAP